MSLTSQEQNRLRYLKMLVSTRVEEYFEDPQEQDTAVPFGDITYELTQAARYVMRQIRRSISFFATKTYDYDTVIKLPDKNGALIPLPSDYSRFTRFKMKGWELAVNEYLSDVSKAYQQQQFRLRRGTAQKPVAFLVPFDQSFEAGTAPAILAEHSLGKGIPRAGDVLTDGNDTEVARVDNTDDPDYVYIDVTDGSYSAAHQKELTHSEQQQGETITYTLTIKYLEDETYSRTTQAGQALEVYPYADGQIETLSYVPYLKPWEVPQEFEDVLVWRAASTVLTTMRRYDDAKAALEQMALAQQAINTGMYGEERRRNGS